MEARIIKENGDYVVYAEIISPDGYTTFKPLRNFGCRQSDAIEYRDSDLNDVTDIQLNTLIRTYNPKVKYKRCVDENGVAGSTIKATSSGIFQVCMSLEQSSLIVMN